MSHKPKVKFLTVIWGERYIEEFSKVALPSFLAPGNLPFLAQATDLEIAIMTSESSVEAFHGEPAFATLKSLCRVRFIFIDDLITTGVYGVTLTLAYARGIRDSGAEQTNTYFVFMNSDFVLADGSLQTLVGKISQGHPCIMAPSLRASSEAVLPTLDKLVDRGTSRLAMPARKLVQLALDNLHPTVIGKTITQDFVSCTTHNQIYWQVDSNTLLGRYHLIFMLAIKPERPMPPVNSYCDYGFVPELVPSGRFTVLDDSDDFFMLELQSAAQEKQFLHCGKTGIEEMARELSRWTTREQRRFAEVDAVFHAGDLPPDLEAVRKEAAAFIAKLHGKMKRKAVDHVRHFYWVFGVEAWLTRRQAEMSVNADAPLPPECGPLYPEHGLLHLAGLRSTYLKILGWMRRLAGAPPNVAIWSDAWLDSRLVLNWIASVQRERPHRRGLLVCTSYSPLARSLENAGGFRVIRARGLTDDPGLTERLKEERYDKILCHVRRADVRQTRKILERLTPLLAPDAVVGVYIEHEASDMDPGNFSWELAQYVDDVLPAGWTGLRIRTNFAGGLSKRRLRSVERRMIRHLWPLTWKSSLVLPAVVVLWPILAGCIAINNWRLRNGYNVCPPYCSSALLSLSRRPTARAVAECAPQPFELTRETGT
jgi:hypothetical protein